MTSDLSAIRLPLRIRQISDESLRIEDATGIANIKGVGVEAIPTQFSVDGNCL